MKNVVAYTRVSTPEQKKGDSIKSQKRTLTRYAKQHDLEIIRWFGDEGLSGKDATSRPAFQRMVSFVEEQPEEIQGILTRDIERLGRNAFDLMGLKLLIVANKLDLIVTETKVFDLEDPYQELLFGTIAGIAEFVRKTNRLKVIEGLARAKERGVVLGRRPIRLKKTPRLMDLIRNDAPYNLIAKLYDVDWRTAKREVLRIKEEETAREAQLHQSAVARNPKVKKRR